jgi:hypothetical protein
MARPTRRWFLALTACAALGGSACNTELQGQADVLMAALDDGDYAKVKTVASESLLADMTESRFADFAQTYDELGEMTDKTRRGTSINGEQKTVTYQLDFADGEVELVVVSNSDKLDGFELRGGVWKRAQVDRHRGALEKLLAAARTGDHAAARALVHPSIADAQLGDTVTNIGKLGEHTLLKVQDDAIPEFRIEFADKAFIGSVRLSGPSIIGYSFRPA